MATTEELCALASELAREAGAFIREHANEVRSAIGTKSSPTDMVTEVDRASEALIVERIRAARPTDAILGEEGGSHDGSSGVRWVIDPLDGTTNYLYGIPVYAVSIAAEVDGETAVGVVYDVPHDELFEAVRGGGARRNGQVIEPSGMDELAKALVGTGFGYQPARRERQAAMLHHLLPGVRDVRRAGSAALDLCSVACGRLDAYYEWGLQPWDMAAGRLIVAEAGGVARFAGWFDEAPLICASNARLAEKFVTTVSAAARETFGDSTGRGQR